LLVGASLFFRGSIPSSLNPLTAEGWVLLVECLAIPFIVDFFVEKQIRRFKPTPLRELVDRFRAHSEKLKWWASALSILLMTAGIATLLARFGTPGSS
jgi:hypothetical protein